MPIKKTEDGVIESLLYGGKIEVKFLGPTADKPSRHIYMVDGVRKTGVTTFIGIVDKSRALISWAVDLTGKFIYEAMMTGAPITKAVIDEACKQHSIKKQQAADIGTEIHEWIEAYIKKQNPAMPKSKEGQIGVTAFLEWIEQNKVKFVSSERVVYSKKHDYIGTLDIEAKVNGKHCLIDIKTSNGIYNTYYMQTAAYVRADEEERDVKYDGRWILRLAKETEKEYNARMVEKGYDSFAAYQVFEAKYLDEDGRAMKRDMDGFIAAQDLFNWNKATDPWLNKNL